MSAGAPASEEAKPHPKVYSAGDVIASPLGDYVACYSKASGLTQVLGAFPGAIVLWLAAHGPASLERLRTAVNDAEGLDLEIVSYEESLTKLLSTGLLSQES